MTGLRVVHVRGAAVGISVPGAVRRQGAGSTARGRGVRVRVWVPHGRGRRHTVRAGAVQAHLPDVLLCLLPGAAGAGALRSLVLPLCWGRRRRRGLVMSRVAAAAVPLPLPVPLPQRATGSTQLLLSTASRWPMCRRAHCACRWTAAGVAAQRRAPAPAPALL